MSSGTIGVKLCHSFSLQSGGTWQSTHIDDLRPPQPNRPEISHLRGQGVHSLLQQDLAAMNIQTGNEGDMQIDAAEARDVVEEENLETMDAEDVGKDENELEEGMDDLEEIAIEVQGWYSFHALFYFLYTVCMYNES